MDKNKKNLNNPRIKNTPELVGAPIRREESKVNSNRQDPNTRQSPTNSQDFKNRTGISNRQVTPNRPVLPNKPGGPYRQGDPNRQSPATNHIFGNIRQNGKSYFEKSKIPKFAKKSILARNSNSDRVADIGQNDDIWPEMGG